VPKQANLMKTAVRYTGEASKITARVTAELSAKRKGGKAQCYNLRKRAREKNRQPGGARA